MVLRDEMGARSMGKSLARGCSWSFALKQTVTRSGPFMMAFEAGGRRASKHEEDDELSLPSVRLLVHSRLGWALPDF